MKNSIQLICLSAAIVAGTATVSIAQEVKHDSKPSFEQLDANGDGQISPAEMAMHRQERFAKADTNGDGMLNEDELIARMQSRMAKRVANMIEQHDTNGDGVISAEEMQGGNGGRMFAMADADDDGTISKAEFDAMKKGHGMRMHKNGMGKHKDEKSAE